MSDCPNIEAALPGCFLADLPKDARLSGSIITDACAALRKNRERQLVPRKAEHIAGVIGCAAGELRNPAHSLRRMMIEQGGRELGFSAPVLSEGLDQLFSELTKDNLMGLLTQEIGNPARLDDFTVNQGEKASSRSAMVRGHELHGHITGGIIPNGAITSMALGLLTKSAQFLKCASGTSLIPRLFAHALHEVDSRLASCVEVAEWPGGSAPLDDALCSGADLLTVTGSDETIRSVSSRLPAKVKMIGFGHKVSVIFIAADGISKANLPRLVSRTADDIVAWDQVGCLSPHAVYLEAGASVTPEVFAAALAVELEQRETTAPRRTLEPAEAGTIKSRRAMYELRAAHAPGTRMWASAGSSAWTVVYEEDPQFQPSCGNRFVYVKPAPDVDQLLIALDKYVGKVSTVGLAASEARAPEISQRLARWGVTRITQPGRMQKPPIGWRHDGLPPLASLVQWTDWETAP